MTSSVGRTAEERASGGGTVVAPCGPFSRLLNCTRGFLQSEKGQEKLRQGREMLKFARDVAVWQLMRGRYFLLEHPTGASSWQEETMQELEQYLGVYKTKIHQCRYGLRTPDTTETMRTSTTCLRN